VRPILLQPTSPSYDTGGFIYNERLCASGCVTLETLDPVAFRTRAHDPDETYIVDSLFMQSPPGEAPEISGRKPHLLVHHLACLADAAKATPEREWLRLSAGAIVTSAFMAERIGALEPGVRVETCPPGVDVAALRSRSAAAPAGAILSVGHVIERKDYVLAARVVARAAEHLPPSWSWRIVGDERFEPAYAAGFRAELASLGIAGRVRLLGPLSPSATAGLYRTAKVFLLCPTFEAYGMAFAEALAAGLPVVATDAGEVGRLVPATHGTICARGDVAGLAKALGDWLTRPPPGEPLSVRTWSDVARDFDAAWQRLTARP